ncbi:MAG: cofC 2 [Nocardioides sp.]|nr:cofC 2 [Nocardioides sp.]
MTADARMLVVAKAPVAGRVKTRLGADIGMEAAAEVAAAALVDSLLACRDAVGPDHCALALDGDLADAVRGDELTRLVAGWSIRPQRGDAFAERLVHAHLGVPAGPGPVVQIGMDTPQVTPQLLLDAAEAARGHDAVLGPAEDGGWWVLALHDPRHARLLSAVEMSTDTTHDDTRRALEGAGLTVASTATLRDVDTVEDAGRVAHLAPDSHFARAWNPVARAAGARP